LLRIGLTGGIASGKSVVGEMFVKLGAQLIQSDALAHRLMEPGQRVYDEVVRHFGPEILNPDRTVNRSKLAEAAFGKAPGTGEEHADVSRTAPTPRVQELNAIVHPAVIAHENEWMDSVGARDPNAIAIVEAALILEAGTADRFDYLVVVTCRPEQRISRFAQRLGISEESARAEVSRRMAAQFSDAKKIEAADFVIDNSGALASTEQQVGDIFSALRRSVL
jgi:dephospho-CoA kinase